MAKKDRQKSIITVQGAPVTVINTTGVGDFISLTDMAKKFGGVDLINNWMRNRNTIEFLGLWEQINNLNFNLVEFDKVKKQVGLNSFRISPQKMGGNDRGHRHPIPIRAL